VGIAHVSLSPPLPSLPLDGSGGVLSKLKQSSLNESRGFRGGVSTVVPPPAVRVWQ